ncbi:MAG: Ig-like domain-containing protein [Lachnospiraceae bacterium]|nr:Ig-like domain-containing protein [Lachnospiraceae bacterium]
MNKKSMLALYLVMMLMVSLVAAPPVDAKKKVSLNKTVITLKKNQTAQLKVKNICKVKKITWTSKSKNIVTVNKKGKIKAKKDGKGIVIAKVGKKKLQCTVFVVPEVKMSYNNTIFTKEMVKQVESVCCETWSNTRTFHEKVTNRNAIKVIFNRYSSLSLREEKKEEREARKDLIGALAYDIVFHLKDGTELRATPYNNHVQPYHYSWFFTKNTYWVVDKPMAASEIASLIKKYAD